MTETPPPASPMPTSATHRRGGDHGGHCADRDEQQRDAESRLTRAGGIPHAGQHRAPCAPAHTEPGERGQHDDVGPPLGRQRDLRSLVRMGFMIADPSAHG
jgi:hypothetical protein